MKYKNFNKVIESFNQRFSRTKIYLNSENNMLKTLYNGIIGDIKENDIKVFNKTMNDKLDKK